MEADRLARSMSAIARFNRSARTDAQPKAAASRQRLRASGLQR